jgi:hypothetical protein
MARRRPDHSTRRAPSSVDRAWYAGMRRHPITAPILGPAAALLALALGGCHEDTVCACAPPGLTLTPAALTIAVGVRAMVAVSAQSELERPRYAWQVTSASVLAIDSTATDGSRVHVRALAPGGAVLTVTATGTTSYLGATTTTASVPVTVTAGAAPP